MFKYYCSNARLGYIFSPTSAPTMQCFYAMKINRKNLGKSAESAVNYLEFIDCNHDAVKKNKGL